MYYLALFILAVGLGISIVGFGIENLIFYVKNK